MLSKNDLDLIEKGRHNYLSGEYLNHLQKLQHQLKQSKNTASAKHIKALRSVLHHQNQLRKKPTCNLTDSWGWEARYY